MEVSIFPSAFINNTTEISIENTNNCILCRKVLEKYQEEIMDNEDGCIFKLNYTNEEFGITIEEYVSCIEFTAPDYTIYTSNDIFSNLLVNLDNNTINVDIFSPPQATFIQFELENENILKLEDIKTNLEELITSHYKFVKLNQTIELIGEKLKIIELEPYHICMVNNTDLEVEFKVPKPTKNVYEEQKINSEEIIEPHIEYISKEEIRQKRIAYYTNKI